MTAGLVGGREPGERWGERWLLAVGTAVTGAGFVTVGTAGGFAALLVILARRPTGRCLVAPGLRRVPRCAAFCTRRTAKIARILRGAAYFWKFRPAAE